MSMEISVIEASAEFTEPLTVTPKKSRSVLKACCAFFYLPPLQESFTKIFATILAYGALWGLLRDDALPGGEVFAVFVLVISAYIGGQLLSIIRLPPLLGMLLVGFLYRNLPFIPYYTDIPPTWPAAFRNGALVIIMLRAGLCLDPSVLKRLSGASFRLSFLPCSVEAVVTALVSYYLLKMSLPLAFCLGFVLAAVSPAVVIPSMLLLEEKGFGQESGIATLIIAATAIENVYAITIFGICIGIAFAKGNLIWTIVKGPLSVLVGLTYGAVVGVFCWHFPAKSVDYWILYRVVLLTFGGLAITFVSQVLDFAAAGPLGCLGISFVAALKWREEEDRNESVVNIEQGIWEIMQIFLFAFIGIEVSVEDIQNDIGYGILIIITGLILRMAVAFLSVFRAGLTSKERVFVAFSWVPKATVQAAIGSIALDIARNSDMGDEYVMIGKKWLWWPNGSVHRLVSARSWDLFRLCPLK